MEKQFFKLHSNGKVCEVLEVENNLVGGKGFDTFVRIIEKDHSGIKGWNRETWVAVCRGEFVEAPKPAKAPAKPMQARKALWIRLVRKSMPKLDMAMMEIIYRYGWYAGLRYCRSVGIDFEDCYYMVFGREPRKI